MPARYVCSVLDEMRAMYKTRNFAGYLGLVEEMQTLVNRMEAAIEEKKDYQHWHDKFKKEKVKYQELVEEANKVRKELGKEEIDPTHY